MARALLLALLSAIALFALTAVPTTFTTSTMSVSGSALAAKNLNTSRSNIYRTKTPPTKPKKKASFPLFPFGN